MKQGFFEVLAAAAGGVIGVLLVRAGLEKDRAKRAEMRPRKTPHGAPEAPGGEVDRAPALIQLLKQIDADYPSRSRASDGMLPSAAHHARNPTSDHERGNALDVTFDASNGPNLDELAASLLGDGRVTYVIWNQRIANRAIDSGVWRPYVQTAIQTDPHTSHLHVSVDAARRGDTSSWRLRGGAQKVPGTAEVVATADPSGYARMAQSHVTPEYAAWAKELLGDPSFQMGQMRKRDFGGKSVLAKVEVHPPSPSIDHPHRGISLFESA